MRNGFTYTLLALTLLLGSTQTWAEVFAPPAPPPAPPGFDPFDPPPAPAPPAPPPPAFIEEEAAGPQLTLDGLQKLMEGLGYEPRINKAGGTLQVDVEHANGETRMHLVGIDDKAGTIFIIVGGFPHSPDASKASAAWFRRLMKINNQIPPSAIFLNDHGVFGLTTTMGNVNVTPARMKAKLKENVTIFDQQLTPLVKELPSMEKQPEENKATGASSGTIKTGGGVAR